MTDNINVDDENQADLIIKRLSCPPYHLIGKDGDILVSLGIGRLAWVDPVDWANYIGKISNK